MGRKVLLFLYLISAGSLLSQSLANYTSVRNTGVTYASIATSGSAISSWRNSGASPLDDNRSYPVNIGFDFWYNGVRYTQVSVSTNGFIDFSSNSDDGGPVADDFGYDNTAFTSSILANYTQLAIAPFYDDLCAPSGATSLGSVIKYSLSGSAPNRTFTIEWVNMQVYLNSTPSLNFQVKLVETTGNILIHYGTMNAGTQLFSYSMGMNGISMGNPPTAAQLKALQGVNGNTFGNTAQNNLSAMPAANSQYVFSPPAPASPTGAISFSGISSTGMTLNWPNWANNETGYVIYNSTDGINYKFVSQTGVNATSAGVSGLTPGTTYYWRVYAVTEGRMSTALDGTQATGAAGNKTSNGSGNWNAPSSWAPAGVPGAGDNVTIQSGHTVQINTSGQCNNLTINAGGSLEYKNGGGAYSFSVHNNITIDAGGQFWIPNNSNATSSLTIRGDVLNNGTLNLKPDFNSMVRAIFTRDGSTTISGTGASTFHTINMNLGDSRANILDIACPSFTASPGFLTLINGTFKLSCTNAASLSPFTASLNLSSSCGLWLNAPNSVIDIPTAADIFGSLTVSGGTMNIGDAADEDLQSAGATISITDGELNVTGKLYSSNSNLCHFSMSGGTVNVATLGSSNTSIAPFQINTAGSTFTMSGGIIIVAREGGSGAQDLGYVNTASGSVTGGTLQLGNAATPAGSTLNVNTSLPVGNFVVPATNVTAKLITNSLSVLQDMTFSGPVFSSSLNISVGGNWTNNGVLFSPGNNLVTFSSANPQQIMKSAGLTETFNHVTFAGAGPKTLGSPISATGNFSIGPGSKLDVSAANHSISVAGNFMNDGGFTEQQGLVLLNGSGSQAIGGMSTNTFYDLTLSNVSGAGLTSNANLRNTLTITDGAFNTNGQVFTMISNAANTARIAQITGSGDIVGDVTVQRHAPGGTTGWVLFGTCISSNLTFADWNDNFAISCPACPDGFPNNFYSIYSYDESAVGSYSNPVSYVPVNAITEPIIPGKGYWVYFGNGFFNTTDITIDVTGTVNKFNMTIPLSYNNYGVPEDDGWNLIHNPYPSAISWAALKGTTPDIDDAVYAYNPDLNGGGGGHATYINGVSSPAVGAGGIGDAIPMGQGFYVHSTGATALNASEAIKVSGNPTFLKTMAAPPSNLLRVHLKGPYNFLDECVVYEQSGASNGFDVSYDAYKVAGADPYVPLVMLRHSGKEFQVNGVPPISGTFTMDLKTITAYPGTYTISASSFSNFPAGACFRLYDRYTQSNHNLKASPYVFYLSDTTSAARFVLGITINPLQVNATVSQPNCAQPFSGQIVACGANAGPWNYIWKDPSGNIVKASYNKGSADTLSGVSAGNYSVQVNTLKQCDNNNSSFNINAVVKPLAQFSCIDTVHNVSQNGLVNFSNLSVNSVLHQWDFGDNLGQSNLVSPVYNYSGVGIYKVTLISSSSTGCQDSAFKTIVVLDKDVSIQQHSLNGGIRVKNLGHGEFLIEKDLNAPADYSYEVRDMLGRLIVSQKPQHSDRIRISLKLQDQAEGIYLLKLNTDNQSSIIRLQVTR